MKGSDNVSVGRIIKGLANTIELCGMVLSIFCGWGMFSLFEDTPMIGCVTIGIVFLCSWISSLFLYGIGQLIENSDILVEQGKKQLSNQSNPQSKEAPAKTQTTQNTVKTNDTVPAETTKETNDPVPVVTTKDDTIICPKCNFEQPKNRKVCWHCGAKFSSNDETIENS